MSTVRVSFLPSNSHRRVYLNDYGNLFGHACPSPADGDDFIPTAPSDAAANAINGAPMPIIGYGTLPPLKHTVAVIPKLTEPVFTTRDLAKDGLTSSFLSESRGGRCLILDDIGNVVKQSDSTYEFDFSLPCNIRKGDSYSDSTSYIIGSVSLKQIYKYK